MEKARLIMHNGSPAIEVDGEIFPPMTVTLLRLDKEYCQSLRKAGVRVFFLTCGTDWNVPNAMEELQEKANILLDAVPDALCFLRITIDPPISWMEDHPEELMQYEDGSYEPIKYYTQYILGETIPGQPFLGSQRWRDEGGKYLTEFLDKLDQTPLRDHIIGYFLAAGSTSEWHCRGELNHYSKNKGAGFSPSERKAFSGYLREKYKTEEALRAAWRDPDATFDDPHIPPMDERYFIKMDQLVVEQFAFEEPGTKTDAKNFNGAKNIGSFLNVDQYMCVFDFFRSFHQVTADSVVYFAELLKKRDDSRMVGAFYSGFACTHFFNNGSAGGTLKILDSCVDYLATPGMYDERQPGGVTALRSMQDSFRLRGKVFIAEDDTRTHRDDSRERAKMRLFTLEDTESVMKRDFGRDICEDIYGWWFDHSRSGDRYQEEGIYNLVARQQEVAKFAYTLDRRKHNQIALLFDEESISMVTQQTSTELCDLFRTSEVHRIGLPVDYYFHNDLARDDMPDYQVYIFVNCFYLTNEERRVIEEKIRKKGKMAIWLYASGFANPDADIRMSADNITALTGIRTKMDPTYDFTNFRVCTDHPSMAGIDPYFVYGNFDRPIRSNVWLKDAQNATYAYPQFYTDDPDATVLGRFCNSNLPALTIKETDGFCSVFCGAKILRADLIQALARYAGCHIWAENTDDVLYANDNFVVMHAASTGEKTLHLPRPCDVFEVYEKKWYGKQVTDLKIPMHFGETKMFSLAGEC